MSKCPHCGRIQSKEPKEEKLTEEQIIARIPNLYFTEGWIEKFPKSNKAYVIGYGKFNLEKVEKEAKRRGY